MMFDFTSEEKERIVNTEITKSVFDMNGYQNIEKVEIIDGYFCTETENSDFVWKKLRMYLEILRRKYLETKDERYFNELVRLLPNSYNVIKIMKHH